MLIKLAKNSLPISYYGETGKDSEDIGGSSWRTWRIIFNTACKAKTLHPTDSENTTIQYFETKTTEIPQEKLSNTAISPSYSSWYVLKNAV